MSVRRKKLILVVSEDWYFLSHRTPLARHFLARGWEVLLATQVNRVEDAARIRDLGIRLIPLPLERGRMFSPGDALYWWRLLTLYRRERPDIVHHVAMKPVLYGSLAALGTPRAGVVNALAGLGYLFTEPGGVVRVVRKIVLGLFRRLFARPRTRVILQNVEDMNVLSERLRVPPGQLRLVRGAGVDVKKFHPVIRDRPARPVVVMASRMLRDKGALDLVAAARLLQQEGISARVQLVGGVDERNPNSHTDAELSALQAEGVVEWLGHRTDIAEIYAQADIAVLPTVYREGLPKSLLEAAASGLPIVTTDIPGCREIVQDGVNGFLVPPQDAPRLAAALRRLLTDPELRARMGANGRRRTEEEFREEIIIEQTAGVYAEIISDARD